MVRSSSVVLPAPGELTRFSARMSRPASQPRTRSASRLFRARTSCSSVIDRAVLVRMSVVVP